MCPFCYKTDKDFFLSTENFGVIYNLSPILPGHSMVIPRQHKESLFELTDEELAEFMKLGRNTARLLTYSLNTNSFDWAIQEKEPAGQSVKHLHMHIVPRQIGDLDNPGDWYQELEKNETDKIDTYNRFRLTDEQIQEITERLRKEAEALKFI